MPLVYPKNNRILPPNARAADVARDTLNAVMPIQARKNDAAFQVNGYRGVLYSYLTSGIKCACQARAKAVNTRLNEEGKASVGAINEMLVASPGFGIRPYATKDDPTPAYKKEAATGRSFLEVDLGSRAQSVPVQLQSLFDESDLIDATREVFGYTDRVQQSGEIGDLNATLEVEQSTSQTEDVGQLITDFDEHLMGHSDVSCPICFGSGYVGGFSILQGHRTVLNFQHPSIILPATALIRVEEGVPPIDTETVSWTILIPRGCVSVDALRLWNDTDPVTSGFAILVDGVRLNKATDILAYSDGRMHTITLNFQERSTFTHLELQFNQSNFWANFELPKLNKGSIQSLLEATDPFTVHLSPRVPAIKPKDVIVESTYGKALHVKTATSLNDRRFTTLGWDVEVRPTQPQELFSMLPRRAYVESQNTRRMVTDNASPNALYGGFPRT